MRGGVFELCLRPLISRINADKLNPCQSVKIRVVEILEVQLQPKLELPRVERGGWAAEVAAVAGALIEGADIVDKRRRSGFIEAVEQVEAFRDQLQPEVLAEWHQLRHAQIERHVTMRQTHVACEASARKHAVCDQRHAARRAGNAECSVSKH